MLKSEEADQFFVVVEKQMMNESGSVSRAVVDIVAAYNTFDMAGSKTWNGIQKRNGNGMEN